MGLEVRAEKGETWVGNKTRVIYDGRDSKKNFKYEEGWWMVLEERWDIWVYNQNVI